MRLGNLVITIHDDALGKPYVTVEATQDDNSPDPLRITLWAEAVKVEDYRSKK